MTRRWRQIASGLLLSAVLASVPAAASDESGMLWRVEGQANSVYLLGSIHMLREADFPLPDNIERAYTEAEALLMELDMDELNPLAVQRLFFTYGSLPEGSTLASILGPERWQQARRTARSLNVDISMLNSVKPWWAALTIVQLQLARLGFDPKLGLEGHFTRRAAEDGKDVGGLETAEFQIRLFDEMSEDRQVEMLLKSLDDAATLEQDMEQLLAAWRRGDTESLTELKETSFKDFPELYAALIKKRNERWVEALRDKLEKQDDYLVVVGALHLVGEDGVPAALARLGYKVVRQ